MLKIKNEIKAKRCEICHQSDEFDAGKNYCTRCVGIENLKRTEIQTGKKTYFEVKETPKDSILQIVIKISYVLILGIVPALIVALIVPNICSSHCRSIFHPFHLFFPLPTFFLGLFVGVSSLYKFKQDIINAVFRIVSSTLIGGLAGSFFGILSTFLSDIPNIIGYYFMEKLLWSAWFGFETGIFLSFTFYLFLILLKLCKIV